jgi:hypothetical protein
LLTLKEKSISAKTVEETDRVCGNAEVQNKNNVVRNIRCLFNFIKKD